MRKPLLPAFGSFAAEKLTGLICCRIQPLKIIDAGKTTMLHRLINSKLKWLLGLIVFSSLYYACDRQNRTITQWRSLDSMPGNLTILWPKNGTIFPAEMVPPSVMWEDFSTEAQKWQIVVSQADKAVIGAAQSSAQTWKPDSSLWATMKSKALREPVSISVLGLRGHQLVSGAKTVIHVSIDSVGAPVFFRAVPLPFYYALHHLPEIRWKLGYISSSKPAATLLTNLPLCGNCHSFSADGRTLAMDVDYANDKGSYVTSDIQDETVLTPDNIITWSEYKQEDKQATFGLLSQISPDGRYVASTVKDRSIFVPKDDLHYSQLFFPIKGIIAIYDRELGRFFPLPGADDPQFVQSNPTWSADGRFLYFARSTAYISQQLEQSRDIVLPPELAVDFIEGRQEFKFDIYRIPFNEGRGGKAVPLPGASGNGKSNFFPRNSPDGLHLVFTQAENFMLLQPDSRLMILPAEGGVARPLACNTDSMNSWHSWSPNGRWLVFASKARSAYTDILLAHINEDGEASPPVLLENFASSGYAANIPEFVNLQNRSWRRIIDGFSNQAHYYFTIGRSKLGEKKPQEAIAAFDQAIRLDPTYGRSYMYKGHIQFANNLFEDALESYQKAAQYIHDDGELFQNLGAAYYKLRHYEQAIAAFTDAVRLQPQNAEAFLGRGLAHARQENYQQALRDFDRAAQLNLTNARIFHERGVC
ncbi:MAG: tetratricopeptide repeat protein, partial [Calditrichaeota bacterium]